MAKLEFKRADFLDTNDGNALTTDERIAEALKLLQTEEDYIELYINDKCYNEEELRKALGLIE